jgi:hypothetical protein
MHLHGTSNNFSGKLRIFVRVIGQVFHITAKVIMLSEIQRITGISGQALKSVKKLNIN